MARSNVSKDLRGLVGKRQKRAFAIKREAEGFDEAARTVPVALTSDEPIFHGFAYIILDHSPGAINLERFAGGLSFLENHDVDRRIGRLREPDTDGHVLRATARFSSRPYADEIFREVIDDLKAGDTPGTSSMFTIDEIAEKPEAEIDGYPVFRATKWTIYEGSIVSIEADITVGVGRSLEDDLDGDGDGDESEDPDSEGGDEEEERNADCGDEETRDGESEDEETRDGGDGDEETNSGGERAAHTPTIQVRTAMEKDKELLALGELLGEVEMARDFVAAGKTAEEFRAAVHAKRQQAQTVVQKPVVEMNGREISQYSYARAILADANHRDGRGENCFELEVSQQIERSVAGALPSFRSHGGVFVPTFFRRPSGPASQPLRRGERLVRSGLAATTANHGQEIVFTEAGEFIDLLRNRAMVLRLGASFFPGLQGNVAFPKQTGSGASHWVGENPGVDVQDDDLSLGQVPLSPKTLMSSTSYSRQLLAQGVIDVDSLVKNDLAKVVALEIDRAGLHGSGANNQPRGLYQINGVNAVAFGGPVSFANVIAMETAIAAANADIGTMAYLTTPEVRGTAKQTAELANTIALALWRDGEMNGYRAEATNQVSKTMLGSAATGGATHGNLFGVWEELLIGEWGAMEVITDPLTKKKQGMVEVTVFNLLDINARHAEAFSKATGQTPS